MIALANDRAIGPLLRRLRTGAGLSQAELGRRTYMTKGGVSKREISSRAVTAGALIETAHVFGYDLALIPKRHPGARPTGTGWPT